VKRNATSNRFYSVDTEARWQSENRCRPDSSILRGSESVGASFIADIRWRYGHLLTREKWFYWLGGIVSHDRYCLVWRQHPAFEQRDLDNCITVLFLISILCVFHVVLLGIQLLQQLLGIQLIHTWLLYRYFRTRCHVISWLWNTRMRMNIL